MATRVPNRKCAICKRFGPEDVMAQVRHRRFEILKRWYPADIRSPKAWTHKSCLTALGLLPFPEDGVSPSDAMGAAVVRRIEEVAQQCAEIRAPRQLARHIFDRLRSEFTIPTANGRQQLRWMIGHCTGQRISAQACQRVTCHLQENRGGIASQMDDGAGEEEPQPVQVRLDNGLFADVMPVAHAADDRGNGVLDAAPNLMVLAQLSLEKMNALKALLDGFNGYAEAYVTMRTADLQYVAARATAETAIIDRRIAEHAERNRGLEQRRKRRDAAAAPSLPAAKRQQQQRYDLSAKVLDTLRADATTTDADAATVYPLVRDYFERRRCLGRPLDVEVSDDADGLPVVHALRRPHRGYIEDTGNAACGAAHAAVAPKYEDYIVRHVQRRLDGNATMPATTITEPPAVAKNEPTSVAPLFLARPPSGDGAAAPERIAWDQLMRDNERLKQRFPGHWTACFEPDDWPPPTQSLQLAWRNTPATKAMRVTDLMQMQGVPSSGHPKWPLFVVIVASYLDDWTPKLGGGYTKARHGAVLRRAALAMRAMDDNTLTALVLP